METKIKPITSQEVIDADKQRAKNIAAFDERYNKEVLGSQKRP